MAKAKSPIQALIPAGIFFLFGVVALASSYGDCAAGVRSAGFAAVPAAITTSRMSTTTSTDSDGLTQTDDVATVSFSYTVAGQPFQSNAIYLSDRSPKSSMFVNARSLLEQYQAGSSTTAYYNEANPSEACLRPGLAPANYAMGAFTTCMLGAALFFSLWGVEKSPGFLRARRAKRRKKKRRRKRRKRRRD